MSTIDFAALLCSRLCHDLVSPVGALSNGLEILSDEHDEEMRDQVLELLNQSARQTSNKLQFFRLAFGAAGGFAGDVDPQEAKRSLDAFFEGSKVRLSWSSTEASLKKQEIKLLLNLALIAGESLIRGGDLSINIYRVGGSRQIDVVASGERVLFSEAMREGLLGEGNAQLLEPKTAPAYLARVTARELLADLSVEASDGKSCRIGVTLP